MKIQFISAPIKWQKAMIKINSHTKRNLFLRVIDLVKPRLLRHYDSDRNKYNYSVSIYIVFKIMYINFY